MDTYKLKWTESRRLIFEFLCVHAGQKFNAREIAKALNLSPTIVSQAAREFEKGKLFIIVKSKHMNLMSITINRENNLVINLKRVENLRLLYESGLDTHLAQIFPGCAIILFGSYSRGEDVWYGENDERSSDIDIAIIGTKEKVIDLKEYEKRLKREISLNFYESSKYIHKHLKNNIFNGILLSGSIEV